MLGLLALVVLICLFFGVIFLVMSGLRMLLKIDGVCSQCGSRLVWAWQERSPDFSHGFNYAHHFVFRKCLRCKHRETVSHGGGYHDTWIDPITGKVQRR